MPFKNVHPISKTINFSLIDLPVSKNINYWWNFGSLLGVSLIIQIITGMFLAMSFIPSKDFAFLSVMNMSLDSPFLWSLQMVHANGASIFFICIFIHVGRGLFYHSYKLKETWMVGVILLFLSMGIAFLGYVLPWGQMSFWGATVITNLLATVPYLGQDLVIWLWGGFAVDSPTLNRFFVLHFILPFLLLFFILIHLIFLHQTGSSNPLGISSISSKISFYPYFIYKDFMIIMLILYILILLVTLNPYLLSDPDNFNPANALSTPPHIQPEWYFLFAYAILRAIPNKLGGVIALLMSILILLILPFLNFSGQGVYFSPVLKALYWFFVFNVILLTWIGMSPMEVPFINVGQVLTMFYFLHFILTPLLMLMEMKMKN